MPPWLIVLAIVAGSVFVGLAWLALVAFAYAIKGPGPQTLVDAESEPPRCYCESCRCARNGVLGLTTSCCPRGLTHGPLCVCAGSAPDPTPIRVTQPRPRTF